MRDDGEDMPDCGPTARTLGARPFGDIPVDDHGQVHPRSGGMSVAVGKPENLPDHRRDEKFDGYGEDPVWVMESDDLPERLTLRRDPRAKSRHAFVEPIEPMTLAAYQEALAVTRSFWTRA
jgi:hypothetical protein